MAVPGPQARTIQVITGKPSHITVCGKLRVQAAPSLVWEVLTNYEESSRIFPSNVASTTVQPQLSGAKHLVQMCRWQFLAFSGVFETQLSVTEHPAELLLVFSLLESSFMRDFEGRWTVRQLQHPHPSHPQPPGDQQQDLPWCDVEHILAVQPAMMPPAPLTSYVHSIFISQVTGILSDLEREVLRKQQARLPPLQS